MRTVDWGAGVQQSEAFHAVMSRYPYGDVVWPTLGWGMIAGISTAFAVALGVGEATLLPLYLLLALTGAFVGLVISGFALIIATVVWAVSAMFRPSVRARATAAAVAPVVVVVGLWGWLIVATGYIVEDLLFTPMVSIGLIVTAVVLAEAMRRRFLAAVAAAAHAVAPPDAS